ncbi:MAG TPA: biotin transporter BioY, partial [Parachlamydiaceae bacterium]|nr:biotin transporter BioY [Parachlamydiaceae bacterium]
LLYLAESMMGFPVLASGKINMLALFGPNGGYLIGFVFQAYLVGWFAERRNSFNKVTLMMGITLACAVQLTVGALWLGQFVGFKYVLAMGILPFIAGEAVKIFAVAGYFSRNDNIAKS